MSRGGSTQATEGAREISYDAFSREPSPTAASATNRLFGVSGEIDYRVVLMNGSAQSSVIVQAATGDEAAATALSRHPGQKVAFVGPSTRSDAVPTIDVGS